jgi:hypothetical protein
MVAKKSGMDEGYVKLLANLQIERVEQPEAVALRLSGVLLKDKASVISCWEENVAGGAACFEAALPVVTRPRSSGNGIVMEYAALSGQCPELGVSMKN